VSVYKHIPFTYSFRRVSSEDIQKCEDKYSKSKMVHSIMRHVSETTGANLQDLYKVCFVLKRIHKANTELLIEFGLAII
jgi:translation initiation factor 2 alpha subunit (eIF-2alpha)